MPHLLVFNWSYSPDLGATGQLLTEGKAPRNPYLEGLHMTGKPAEVSAFEAKTRLSELLREAERGRSFVIRRRGKAVAQLIPAAKDEQALDLAEVLAAFRAIRRRIPGPLKVRELIEEGRRY
jgi:prevent-host-death family protein